MSLPDPPAAPVEDGNTVVVYFGMVEDVRGLELVSIMRQATDTLKEALKTNGLMRTTNIGVDVHYSWELSDAQRSEVPAACMKIVRAWCSVPPRVDSGSDSSPRATTAGRDGGVSPASADTDASGGTTS